ncbi:MAG: enoyl-CoA hydratase/isomerase family protein [Proteobacteria bacterium]|nr:enoyl-CoA hydratase/isomerase family protein [Pseudomonadota bacterium]MBU1452750.1 enoyl-CoA hydratase/isomerase family protein [Pseudomonadota bacterium]MBU2467890.1 enoyl-CoA hydratase/isomerase family protein [Pseudomonadota bacterium]MBU2519375.1 enoyl-CoA hydratase/isomerase family protein [Pseudomonadota bacterium]
MDYQYLHLQRQGHTQVLTVDFPPSNALDPRVRDELSQAIGRAAEDDEVWSLVITAAGEKFFMAGANIRALVELDEAQALARAQAARDFLDSLWRMPKPVIAAINGYCLGGGLELALACDIRVAALHAELGLPEVTLGLMPGGGGTQRLPLVVGQGLARDLIMTGRRLKADEALAMGLVQRVAPSGKVLEEALAVAERINANGPLGVRAAKQALNAAAEMPLDQAFDAENRLWASLFNTQDLRRGVEAFLGKSKPRYEAN